MGGPQWDGRPHPLSPPRAGSLPTSLAENAKIGNKVFLEGGREMSKRKGKGRVEWGGVLRDLSNEWCSAFRRSRVNNMPFGERHDEMTFK